MVKIPTARDVSYANTRSGRIANSGPTPMIGAAMADAGQAVVQASYSLQELAEREKIDIANDRSNEVSTSLTRFLADEEQRFLDARDKSSESGIGFTRQFMEGHQARANAFAKQNFEGLTKDAQTGYLNNILSRGNSLYTKAEAFENETKAGYYDRTTNTNLDTYRTQIQSNSANFGDLRRQGLEAINSANMPEPWKAERRQQWEADAAESKWRWKFKQNPQTAIQDVRGTGSLVDKIIGVESGGNATAKNANSSATGAGQFIASTWMNMIKQYRPDLAEGRSARDVLALRNDPAISREMTQRYAEENANYLRNQGLQTTDGNIYLAHFLGPRGAAQVLKADPSASVESIVGRDAVNANGFLRGKTAADLVAWSDKKMGGAGVTSQMSRDTSFDAIPYERREQLAAWGETQYSQQRTKQRAAAKDDYSLLIATQPESVRESVILSDPTLDNGDKADLVKTLRIAQKESGGVNAMISAMANGIVSINPFDNEQTKIADKTYDKLLGAAEDADQQKVITSDFVARTGYIPKKVQAELRNGAASTDPPTLAQSMEAGLVLWKNAPESFRAFEGSEAVRKKMDLYRAFTQDMGFSPEEAAGKLIKANDPQYASQREALLKSKTVADELKKVDAASVAATFDNSFLGLASNPSLGPNELAVAAMVADYRKIYEEAIVDADGDLVAAKKSATDRFQRAYGVSSLSSMGSNVVVKYPPEKAYPAGADGTHNYVRDQLAAALKEQGVEADEVFLNPDTGTERDILAGRTPGYRVLYKKDGKLELFNFPFYADTKVAKDEALKTSEEKMLENRTAVVDDAAAGRAALEATEGSPDWIKAQAVEAARYKSMIDRARAKDTVVNPGPIGGALDDEMTPTPGAM